MYKVLSVSVPTHHRVSQSYKAVVLSPLASVQHSLEEGEGRRRREGERGRREGRWRREGERSKREKKGRYYKGEGRVGMRREGGEGEESFFSPRMYWHWGERKEVSSSCILISCSASIS